MPTKPLKLFLLFFPLAISVTATLSLADTIYVDQDASGAGTGTSWADAHTSLQDALDRVEFGDSVWVAAGEFFPTRRADNDMPDQLSDDPRDATFWIPRGVQLFGGFAGHESSPDQRDVKANPTTLNGDIGEPGDDSDNAHRVVLYRSFHGGGFGDSDHDQTITALIDGFRVINGNAQEASGTDNVGIGGGGMLFRSASDGTANYTAKIDARNCEIAYNKTDYKGAGMAIGVSAATITNCHFHHNHALQSGGALHVQGVVGAAPSQYTFNITSCTFNNNTALKSGGAIHQPAASTPNVSGRPNRTYINNCVFLENQAIENDGGAIHYNDLGSNSSTLVISNSLLARNSAGDDGGALYVNTFESGPLVFRSDSHIFNSTIAYNIAADDGGAIGLGEHSESSIHNSVIWGNAAVTNTQVTIQEHVSMLANIIQGGFDGNDFTFNLDVDPLFFDPDENDFSLRNDSPAINAGWDLYIPLDVADLDADSNRVEFSPHDVAGRSRRLNAGRSPTGLGDFPLVDLGAYERCNADMNRDGRTDFYDVVIMIRGYLEYNPDTDLNADGQHTINDILRFMASFDEGC